ncbi:hypothetical protein [Flavivirga rizhaonensis]|uniref:Uncharacterized protein n=1 Tax=Flavivirga rizhaonensis TaxID=2559571 RepID=A0A4S1E036_9FLAO|nr:hypothetical protein [Flavivirga rizhaonensis]TGV03643.1 hypothetical protein EM932_06355 [Flavivirga rizhaonensis]
MKKLRLFIIFLMMSYMCFSQNLKPIVQQIKTDKRFCFSIEQSRFIAKKLQINIYQDSIIDRLTIENKRWQSLLFKKDSIDISFTKKVHNLELINENKNEALNLLNESLKTKDKEIKRGKFHKLLLGSGLLIMTGILITK